MPRLLFLIVVISIPARPASAQVLDVFSGLFDSVNSIVFYGTSSLLLDETAVRGTAVGDEALVGLGVEVLLNIDRDGPTVFELGLGTSVDGGFEATAPSLDLRGSFRTLPQVAVYASEFGIPETTPVTPYLGLTFGVVDLWNAVGYDDAGTAVPVSGTTYQIGATAGIYMQQVLPGLYAEVSLRQRDFASLRWDTETLPASWPRSINASLLSMAVGWQFSVGDLSN